MKNLIIKKLKKKLFLKILILIESLEIFRKLEHFLKTKIFWILKILKVFITHSYQLLKITKYQIFDRQIAFFQTFSWINETAEPAFAEI